MLSALAGSQREALREQQERIQQSGGMRYPLMKLVDMYFWQIGFERAQSAVRAARP
jgi:hypothetical protein